VPRSLGQRERKEMKTFMLKINLKIKKNKTPRTKRHMSFNQKGGRSPFYKLSMGENQLHDFSLLKQH
jgi:DNA primase catalytic subunit